jgi:predicted DNA-binding transcriptional regulator AlpA
VKVNLGKIDETTTTKDVAVMIGVSLPTLKRWLSRTRVPKPQKLIVGKRHFWRWTQQDIEKLEYWKVIYYHRELERRPRRIWHKGMECLSRDSSQAWIKYLNAKSPKAAKHWRKVAEETQFQRKG